MEQTRAQIVEYPTGWVLHSAGLLLIVVVISSLQVLKVELSKVHCQQAKGIVH